MGITAVDAHSGRTLAYTDHSYPPGTVVLFGGKPMAVKWVEKYRFGLTHAPGKEVTAPLLFRKSYAAIPFVVTRTVAHALELAENEMALLPQTPGQFLFHFWGTVWGELLAAVLIAQGLIAEPVNEYCLYMQPALTQLPEWDEKLVRKAAKETAVTLANRLQMGRFHRLLPAGVALDAVTGQLNLPAFGQQYRAAALRTRPELQEQLHLLVGG
jgi:hypothetical protein